MFQCCFHGCCSKKHTHHIKYQSVIKDYSFSLISTFYLLYHTFMCLFFWRAWFNGAYIIYAELHSGQFFTMIWCEHATMPWSLIIYGSWQYYCHTITYMGISCIYIDQGKTFFLGGMWLLLIFLQLLPSCHYVRMNANDWRIGKYAYSKCRKFPPGLCNEKMNVRQS